MMGKNVSSEYVVGRMTQVGEYEISVCYSKLVKDKERTKCLKSSSSFYRNVTVSLKRN